MNSQKKITVAIPTYNRRGYLAECLQSLQRQTFQDFQIIIFDNASNYDVNEFISQFPKLKILTEKNERNTGGFKNIEKIIKYNFSTSYVIMLHDDDTIHPKYFELATNFLESHPEAVWVGSNIKFIPPSHHHKINFFKEIQSSDSFVEINKQELLEKLSNRFDLGFGSIVYRTEMLNSSTLRYQEFDKWCDRPFIIDLMKRNTAGISNGKLMNYRIHTGQDSKQIESSKINNLINLLLYYKKHNSKRDSKEYKIKETNYAIVTATGFSNNLKEFLRTLKILQEAGLFNLTKINIDGLYYFLKFIKKLFLQA